MSDKLVCMSFMLVFSKVQLAAVGTVSGTNTDDTVVDDLRIQRIVLVTKETTVTQQS